MSKPKPSQTFLNLRRTRLAQAQEIPNTKKMSLPERAILGMTDRLLSVLQTTRSSDMKQQLATLDWTMIPDACHILATAAHPEALKCAPIDWLGLSVPASPHQSGRLRAFPHRSIDRFNWVVGTMWFDPESLLVNPINWRTELSRLTNTFWSTMLDNQKITGDSQTKTCAFGGQLQEAKLIDIALSWSCTTEIQRLLPSSTWSTPQDNTQTAWAFANALWSEQADPALYAHVLSRLDWSKVDWSHPCAIKPSKDSIQSAQVPLAALWLTAWTKSSYTKTGHSAKWSTQTHQSMLLGLSHMTLSQQTDSLVQWVRLIRDASPDVSSKLWSVLWSNLGSAVAPQALAKAVSELLPNPDHPGIVKNQQNPLLCWLKALPHHVPAVHGNLTASDARRWVSHVLHFASEQSTHISSAQVLKLSPLSALWAAPTSDWVAGHLASLAEDLRTLEKIKPPIIQAEASKNQCLAWVMRSQEASMNIVRPSAPSHKM